MIASAFPQMFPMPSTRGKAYLITPCPKEDCGGKGNKAETSARSPACSRSLGNGSPGANPPSKANRRAQNALHADLECRRRHHIQRAFTYCPPVARSFPGAGEFTRSVPPCDGPRADVGPPGFEFVPASMRPASALQPAHRTRYHWASGLRRSISVRVRGSRTGY